VSVSNAFAYCFLIFGKTYAKKNEKNTDWLLEDQKKLFSAAISSVVNCPLQFEGWVFDPLPLSGST